MPEEFRSVRAQLPPQVEDLVASFRDPFTQIEFLGLITDGGVLEPVLADAAIAARMAGPYAWPLAAVAGDFAHNLFQQNWQADWQAHGVLVGTLDGVGDAAKDTGHQLLLHLADDLNPF